MRAFNHGGATAATMAAKNGRGRWVINIDLSVAEQYARSCDGNNVRNHIQSIGSIMVSIFTHQEVDRGSRLFLLVLLLLLLLVVVVVVVLFFIPDVATHNESAEADARDPSLPKPGPPGPQDPHHQGPAWCEWKRGHSTFCGKQILCRATVLIYLQGITA